MLIGTTIKGIEEIAEKELKKSKKILPGRLLFESNTNEFQSLLMLYTYITHFKFKDADDLIEKLKPLKLTVEEPFKVECKREGDHDFSSQDIAAKYGAYLAENLNPDLKKPKTVVYLDIQDKNCIVGLNPINLSKRHYRVKTTSQSLNSTVAFSLSIFADIKESYVIVDPFCKSSDILIEAARYSKSKKIFGLDQIIAHIRNSKINSKLAKVELTIYQLDLDWLETKFDGNSVDRILTFPPIYTALKKDVLNIYKEFYIQADKILKKTGKICLITTTPDQIIFSKNFKIEKRLDFKHGDLNYSLLLFQKA